MSYTKAEGVFNKQFTCVSNSPVAGIELNFTTKAVKRVDQIQIGYIATGGGFQSPTNMQPIGRVIIYKGGDILNRLNSPTIPVQPSQIDGSIIADIWKNMGGNDNMISFFPSLTVNPEDTMTIWLPGFYDPTTGARLTNSDNSIIVNGQYLAYKQTTRLDRKDFLNRQDAE